MIDRTFKPRTLGIPFLAFVVLCHMTEIPVAEGQTKMSDRIIGMYVHQHWPYNHPYAARTWTIQDWRGYADGLKRIGYNTIMVWPMLETMPDPLTPSDQANIEKIAKVIEVLHAEFGMRVWIALCPNVGVRSDVASKSSFEKRHFFYCDTRVNPGDAAAIDRLIAWREKLFRPLASVDGVSIIDSDPGGYVGSTNEEFVHLLMAHRRMFDRLRPGIELIYWMHVGWLGYNRFYQTGKLMFSTPEENADVLERLKKLSPEPWGIANGLVHAQKAGVAAKVISFSYGRIEGEPSFPLTNYTPDNAFAGGKESTTRGVMGNAQTHCVQLPNTFAFVRGATGQTIGEGDFIRFAEDLIPGQGLLILKGWQALAGRDTGTMRQLADKLQALPDDAIAPGPLKGLLFGDPRRFIVDLVMQLRARADFEDFRSAAERGGDMKEPLGRFVASVEAWQQRHGYENHWGWTGMDAALRKLNDPEINQTLSDLLDPFRGPPADFKGTPFEYVQKGLADTESFAPRLIAAMKKVLARMK